VFQIGDRVWIERRYPPDGSRAQMGESEVTIRHLIGPVPAERGTIERGPVYVGESERWYVRLDPPSEWSHGLTEFRNHELRSDE
jgi:hypothetical protein